MKQWLRAFTVMATIYLLSVTSVSADTAGQSELRGDVKLACEALLCLSTSTRPSECAPSIRRYLDVGRDVEDAFKARMNFLRLCPAEHDSQQTEQLANDIVYAADRCNAGALNQRRRIVKKKVCDSFECRVIIYSVVRNDMPSYCVAWYKNTLTDIALPVYVGSSDNSSGHWVDD